MAPLEALVGAVERVSQWDVCCPSSTKHSVRNGSSNTENGEDNGRNMTWDVEEIELDTNWRTMDVVWCRPLFVIREVTKYVFLK